MLPHGAGCPTVGGMMFEPLILLAAAAGCPAESAPAATDCGHAVRAVDPAIIEMTYDAFVAVEETPGLSEIIRSAVAATPDKQPAIAIAAGTRWIS
jgi:hypothetical protein